MQQKNGTIQDALYWLLTNERFYGYLISDMIIHYTDKVPVAGVNIQKGKINLYINKEAWAENDLAAQIKILKHEIMHVIKGHIARAIENNKKFDNGANIAADCAINQLIGLDGRDKIKIVSTNPETGKKEVTETEGITIDNFREAIVKSSAEAGIEIEASKIEATQSMDYYLQLIKEQQKNGKGQEYDSFDDHQLWQESDCTLEELKQIKKKAFKDALDKLSGKEAGSIPSDLLREINDLIKVNVNWKAELNRQITSALEYLKIETRKKRNRRYGLKYPGYRKDPKINLLIGIDTSGSIGYEEAQVIFSNVKKILDTFNEKVSVYVIECDTQIQREYKLDKAPTKADIKGGGGTSYKPFFDFANNYKPDILLIFGDGYCFDTSSLVKPKYPTIWAIDEAGEFPVDWGKKISIPLTNLRGNK